ncbi:MAG: flagellar biosynthetic protein FliO [Nitrospirales bacterium]
MDLTYEAFKMAGALALVVLILLCGLAWVKRTFGESPGLSGEPVMRVLGGLRIGTGKQIMLVDVAGEVLVLGTTARDMTLLTKITDEERTGRMRAQANPVVSRIGAWVGHWAHPASEKKESSAFSQTSPVRISKC